ncbi:hypothetical protein KM043_003889 [Ampulex compressa]|nr:hypothetical protein KM043_003889 [Ampulex compressa]
MTGRSSRNHREDFRRNSFGVPGIPNETCTYQTFPGLPNLATRTELLSVPALKVASRGVPAELAFKTTMPGLENLREILIFPQRFPRIGQIPAAESEGLERWRGSPRPLTSVSPGTPSISNVPPARGEEKANGEKAWRACRHNEQPYLPGPCREAGRRSLGAALVALSENRGAKSAYVAHRGAEEGPEKGQESIVHRANCLIAFNGCSISKQARIGRS